MAEIDKKDKIIKLEDFAAHMKQLAQAIGGQTSENASKLALLVVKAIEELENKIPKDYVDTTNIQTVGGKKTFTKPITVQEEDYKSVISTTWDGNLNLKAAEDEVILEGADGARVKGDNGTGKLYFGSTNDSYISGNKDVLTIAGTNAIDLSGMKGLTFNKQPGTKGQVLMSNGDGEMPTWEDAPSSGGNVDTSKFVTTNTDQEIVGIKTFKNRINIGEAYIAAQETGPGEYKDLIIDANTINLISQKSLVISFGGKEYGFGNRGAMIDGVFATPGQYFTPSADGGFEWKDIPTGGSTDTSKFVTTDGNQIITGQKTFNNEIKLSSIGFTNGNGWNIYSEEIDHKLGTIAISIDAQETRIYGNGNEYCFGFGGGSGLAIDGVVGKTGQVLTSNGFDKAPEWRESSYKNNILKNANSATSFGTTNGSGPWSEGKWRRTQGIAETVSKCSLFNVSDAPDTSIQRGWRLERFSGSTRAFEICQEDVPVSYGQRYTLFCYARKTPNSNKNPILSMTSYKDDQNIISKRITLTSTQWTPCFFTFAHEFKIYDTATNIYFGNETADSVIEICGMSFIPAMNMVDPDSNQIINGFKQFRVLKTEGIDFGGSDWSAGIITNEGLDNKDALVLEGYDGLVLRGYNLSLETANLMISGKIGETGQTIVTKGEDEGLAWGYPTLPIGTCTTATITNTKEVSGIPDDIWNDPEGHMIMINFTNIPSNSSVSGSIWLRKAGDPGNGMRIYGMNGGNPVFTAGTNIFVCGKNSSGEYGWLALATKF